MNKPDMDFVLPNGQTLGEAIEADRRERERRDRKDAWTLIAAGWTFEAPDRDYLEIWQWRWRRPGKRPGKPGRLFASTSQALNALAKEGNGRG